LINRDVWVSIPLLYRGAGGESSNGFIHELGIVRRHLVPTETIEPIQDECDQLVRIVPTSKTTAGRNARLGKKREEEEQ
jgi:hypothetical protein